MRRFRNFNPKVFVVSIAICAAVAGILAWFSKISFGWIFLAVAVAAFINGLIAEVEDRDESRKEDILTPGKRTE